MSNNYWIFNFFHYKRTTDGFGCVTFDSHLGLNGYCSLNFDYHLCSDGLQFCFVPVQSALDYGTLGTISLNEDIVNENITTKLGLVKADVIIGYPGDYAQVNHHHVGFRNDHIYNITGTANPATNSFPYTYSSCVKYNDTVQRGIINMEIGDEELYLENVTLSWHGAYETEFDIYVNKRNPHYEYPSQPYTGWPMLEGIYSKKDDYLIDATKGEATFYTDITYSPFHVGLDYAAPTSGPFNNINQSLPICCINFLNERKANEVKPNEPHTDSYLTAYPNPNNGNQLMLQYQLKTSGQAIVEIFNLFGKKIFSKSVLSDNITGESTTVINLNHYSLTDGLYLIRVQNGSEVISTKLI